MIPRPPIVAVLGHIDHGKTTLLDFIRHSAVAAKEAGGITQHTGAYEIIHTAHNGVQKKITFLDTPGHEAFSRMRARGAKVADIAVLVVAADEGVKPQTLEALAHINASGALLVVAINKIDKPEAHAEKVKQQLAEKGVLLEGWGGTVPNQELSAKSGKGVPELLSLIVLVAELAELKADPTLPAQGIVIETRKDSRAGNAITLLITNGTLRQGEYLSAGKAIGKIRSIITPGGVAVSEATFSSPVVVAGFEMLPEVGEQFHAHKDKKSAQAFAESHASHTAVFAGTAREDALSEKKILYVVLKTDVAGTQEALEHIIQGMDFPKAAVKTVKADVGEVTEGDIGFAESAGAIIAAFKVKSTPSAVKFALERGVALVRGETVYELADAIKEKLRELLPPEITRNEIGRVSVRATFKMEKTKMVVGGAVSSGKVKKGAKVEVSRKGAPLFTGKITQLQHNKEEATEVQQGRECGMMIVPSAAQETLIAAGDELLVYEEKMTLQALE